MSSGTKSPDEGAEGLETRAPAEDPEACRRLFLVRHGETLYGGDPEGALPGSDLTERGYHQIEVLAELFGALEVDAIYASPLGRAQATARTLARRSGIPITTVDDLREIVPGDVVGKGMAEIFAQVRAFFGSQDTHWDTPYLGGETYSTLRARVWPFCESLARRSDWRRVVVVAHGGVNNAIIGQIIGASGPRLPRVDQDFGCLNIIDFFGAEPILRLLNFTAYDPLKASMEVSSMEILKRVLESGFGLSLPGTGNPGR